MTTLVTVTGTYQYGNQPAKGRVVITPNVDSVTDSAGNKVVYGSYFATLDANGSFSIDLLATDDPGNNPLDFGYILECQFTRGVLPDIEFGLPGSLGTLDLTDSYPAVGEANYVPVLQGFSAYQVATRNGFVGTEQQWLDSLVGPVGPQGPKGDPGSGNIDSVNGDVGPDVVLGAADVNAEPSIAAGTVTQYWRGDKSWQTLNKASVGLGSVDNTSDVNKPVSTAQQTALNAKLNHTNGTLTGYKESTVNDATTAVTVDFNAGNVVNCTGTGAVTVSWANIPAGTANAIPVTLRLGSTVTSATWPAGTKFAGGSAPTLSGETWITAVAFNGVVTVGLAWDSVA